MVRVIAYTIDTDGEPQIYRLITSLTDFVLFPAFLLAMEYHQRWEVENTIDELKIHLLGRKTPIRSLNPREEVLRNIWLASWAQSLCVPSCSRLPIALKSLLYD